MVPAGLGRAAAGPPCVVKCAGIDTAVKRDVGQGGLPAVLLSRLAACWAACMRMQPRQPTLAPRLHTVSAQGPCRSEAARSQYGARPGRRPSFLPDRCEAGAAQGGVGLRVQAAQPGSAAAAAAAAACPAGRRSTPRRLTALARLPHASPGRRRLPGQALGARAGGNPGLARAQGLLWRPLQLAQAGGPGRHLRRHGAAAGVRGRCERGPLRGRPARDAQRRGADRALGAAAAAGAASSSSSSGLCCRACRAGRLGTRRRRCWRRRQGETAAGLPPTHCQQCASSTLPTAVPTQAPAVPAVTCTRPARWRTLPAWSACTARRDAPCRRACFVLFALGRCIHIFLCTVCLHRADASTYSCASSVCIGRLHHAGACAAPDRHPLAVCG